MLAGAIICLIFEFLLLCFSGLLAMQSGAATFGIVAFAILGIVHFILLFVGIGSIKDRDIRGRAIGTTAVSAVGVLFALIGFLTLIFVVMIIRESTSEYYYISFLLNNLVR